MVSLEILRLADPEISLYRLHFGDTLLVLYTRRSGALTGALQGKVASLHSLQRSTVGEQQQLDVIHL